MASSVYKWLLIPLLGGLFAFSRPNPHPFHVTVVEINHNADDRNLEISCKIFTDDFEKVLVQNYKTRVDLINPPDRKATDKLVSDYINTHLQLVADGKPVKLSYIGFERDGDAIYTYIEVPNIPQVKNIAIVNKLMYDLFDDQTNLMHVIVGGERKSGKVEYPKNEATFTF
jgi:hypothetical protein